LSTGSGAFFAIMGLDNWRFRQTLSTEAHREIEDGIEEGSLPFGFVQICPNEAREAMIRESSYQCKFGAFAP
jgi:hypothetical protein